MPACPPRRRSLGCAATATTGSRCAGEAPIRPTQPPHRAFGPVMAPHHAWPLDAVDGESRSCLWSEARHAKDDAILAKLRERFEDALRALHEGRHKNGLPSAIRRSGSAWAGSRSATSEFRHRMMSWWIGPSPRPASQLPSSLKTIPQLARPERNRPARPQPSRSWPRRCAGSAMTSMPGRIGGPAPRCCEPVTPTGTWNGWRAPTGSWPTSNSPSAY